MQNKQPWILPMIEARAGNWALVQEYYQGGNIAGMSLKEIHGVIQSYDFQYWYYCPGDLWIWAMQCRQVWKKEDWKKRYREYRIRHRLDIMPNTRHLGHVD